MKLEWDALTIEIAQQLKDQLLTYCNASDSDLSLDLSQVNKIDLSALQLLLGLRKSLENQQRRLHLINCSSSVTESLKLCGCDALLECHDE